MMTMRPSAGPTLFRCSDRASPDLAETLRRRLLSMRRRDEQCRAELAADGTLFEGYHPRMESVHRANAQALQRLIDLHGWPGEELVGADGAEAAWLVAQHAICEPDFMRGCRALLDEASANGCVPRWQFAYIDDRIRVLEGRPQRFGTQIDLQPQGPVPCELEDPSQVDVRRRELGLPALSVALAAALSEPLPTPADHATRQANALSWRREVGWLT